MPDRSAKRRPGTRRPAPPRWQRRQRSYRSRPVRRSSRHVAAATVRASLRTVPARPINRVSRTGRLCSRFVSAASGPSAVPLSARDWRNEEVAAPGTVARYRQPLCPSPSARRNTPIWTLRLPSSTRCWARHAHELLVVDHPPARSIKAISISRARLPRGRGLPASSRSRCAGSRRKCRTRSRARPSRSHGILLLAGGGPLNSPQRREASRQRVPFICVSAGGEYPSESPERGDRAMWFRGHQGEGKVRVSQ